MPIRLLIKNKKPYAYTWGWHGAHYLISKYGAKGAYEKAVRQSKAAHSHGFTEKR
jgi:hypothetical protein